MRHISDVPSELRGRTSYPVVIRRVRVTTFARTEFGEPEINVRESPEGGTADQWLVTAGSNGCVVFADRFSFRCHSVCNAIRKRSERPICSVARGMLTMPVSGSGTPLTIVQ